MQKFKRIGFIADFIINKGLDKKEAVVTNLENPLFYYDETYNKIQMKKSNTPKDLFATLNDDMHYRTGNEDYVSLVKNGAVEIKKVNLSDLDIVEFDMKRGCKDLRISEQLATDCLMHGKIITTNTGNIVDKYRYFYQSNNGSSIPLFNFPSIRNNFCIIRQENDSDLIFIDGAVEYDKSARFIDKTVYINEVILKAYLNVLQNGYFMAEGIENKISATLPQIFNFFTYKTKIGFNAPKVSYLAMAGGRKRESWKLRSDVIQKHPAQVCWLKETDKFPSVIDKVEVIASNPRVAKTSMSQGEKFCLFNTEESARKWESLFIEGKYDVSATIAPTMKADKDILLMNMVFLTIVNEKDNNAYGNALSQKDIAMKTYAWVLTKSFGKVVTRVKYSCQKASSNIKVTDAKGKDVQNWMICPISETDPADGFVTSDKTGNIAQLLHMGLTPEVVVVEVEGVAYQAIMFKRVRQYIDYLTSSDYNVDKSFELKPYSTMFSCISNHIIENFGDKAFHDFKDRLTSVIDKSKVFYTANLAKRKTINSELSEINYLK